ncbi:DUF3953 domain-containing protein [Solibacillus daqui]|uniref:DUF3953 domain-containing protein n=1 Tax=Solibacillus daqui TaxID=2912187 RepID=UPI002366EDF1|nr:DUF3953 domain-containing protein [Solibacillus daqui]
MEAKKFDILMLFQFLFAVLVILIGIYGKVTENYNLLPLMLILLSVTLFIMGLREYKRTQNLLWGTICLCISLYIFFVAVEGIMFN